MSWNNYRKNNNRTGKIEFQESCNNYQLSSISIPDGYSGGLSAMRYVYKDGKILCFYICFHWWEPYDLCVYKVSYPDLDYSWVDLNELGEFDFSTSLTPAFLIDDENERIIILQQEYCIVLDFDLELIHYHTFEYNSTTGSKAILLPPYVYFLRRFIIPPNISIYSVQRYDYINNEVNYATGYSFDPECCLVYNENNEKICWYYLSSGNGYIFETDLDVTGITRNQITGYARGYSSSTIAHYSGDYNLLFYVYPSSSTSKYLVGVELSNYQVIYSLAIGNCSYHYVDGDYLITYNNSYRSLRVYSIIDGILYKSTNDTKNLYCYILGSRGNKKTFMFTYQNVSYPTYYWEFDWEEDIVKVYQVAYPSYTIFSAPDTSSIFTDDNIYISVTHLDIGYHRYPQFNFVNLKGAVNNFLPFFQRKPYSFGRNEQ